MHLEIYNWDRPSPKFNFIPWTVLVLTIIWTISWTLSVHEQSRKTNVKNPSPRTQHYKLMYKRKANTSFQVRSYETLLTACFLAKSSFRMLLQNFSVSGSFPFLLFVLCCAWSSGKSFFGFLIWRPLSLLPGPSLAAIGPLPPLGGGTGGSYGRSNGDDGSADAGVVVSAFRFTPFLVCKTVESPN